MKVAIIPARGGSKRLPRKNVREFAGKPMIAYSIECALRSGLFERVAVSTDDAEIAAIAREFGAEVPFTRPAHLSDDHVGLTDVIAHATQHYKDRHPALEAVCCVYATAPFMAAEDLARGLKLLDDSHVDYVFSATSFGYPIFRSFHVDAGHGVRMFFPEHFNSRSQDLPEALHDAAQFCWGRVDAWLAKRRVFDEHSRVVLIPRWRVQDIDTEEDWTRAEAMAAYLFTRGVAEEAVK